MILKEISVENWGPYTSPKIVQFTDGSNLLEGANETGKSALLKAVPTVLFTKHTTNDVVKDMQPVGKKTSPRISIVFSEGGMTYKLEKQYLSKQYCKLWDDQGNLLAEDDNAHSMALEFIRGSKAQSRRETERGLIEALWFLQDEDYKPTNPDRFATQVNVGLARATGGLSLTPAEKRIRDTIRKEYDRFYTAGGKETQRVGSPVATLRQKIEDLQSEITRLEGEKAIMDDLVNNLQTAHSMLMSKEDEKAELEERMKGVNLALIDGEAISQRLSEFQRDYDALEGECTRLRGIRGRVEERIDNIERSLTLSKDLDALLQGKKSEAEKHEMRSTFYHEQAERSNTSYIESEKKHLHLQLLKKQLDDKKRLKALNAQKESRDELSKEAVEKQDLLRSINAPSSVEMSEIIKVSHELALSEEAVRERSVHIRFELRADIDIVAVGSERDQDGSFTIAQPTTFNLGELGNIHIAVPSPSQEETEKRNALKGQLVDLTRSYGEVTIDQLQTAATQRGDLETALGSLKDRLELIGDVDETELDNLRELVIRQETELSESDAKESITEAELATRILVAEGEKKRLGDEWKSHSDRENEERRLHGNCLSDMTNIGAKVAGEITARELLEKENRIDLKDFGNLDELKQSLKKKEDALIAKKTELDAQKSLYDSKVKEPKAIKDGLDAAIREATGQIQGLIGEMGNYEGQINGLTEADLDANISDSSEELNMLQRELHSLVQKAEAIKLLNGSIQMMDAAQLDNLSGPIKAILDPWVDRLTNGGHRSVNLDKCLLPCEVEANSNYLNEGQLSRGTREQLLVLTRLAIGVMASKRERNLIVLDDRLVNSDPTRLKVICDILNEVCKDCQLIMTTCDASRYDTKMFRTVINLP